MITILGSLTGVLLAVGIVLAIIGIRGMPPAPPRPPRQTTVLTRRLGKLPRAVRIAAVVALIVGVIIAIATGWLIAAIVLPAAVLLFPVLIGTGASGAQQIRKLEAMEEWTRSLGDVLTVGTGLEQAILATVRSVPDPIKPEVSSLVARLRARWSTTAAIRAFADDLDDSTGDLIAASLILGSERRGSGLSDVLHGLAASVADDVRGRRQVEADREKPRTTARWATIISAVVIGLMFFSTEYIAPYSTPLGQTLLTAYLALYVGLLLWLRRMTLPKPTPRFIGTELAARRDTTEATSS